jgi:hypothetical protein
MNKRKLRGVRIPLPRQRGGVVESKKLYRRRPRTPRLTTE